MSSSELKKQGTTFVGVFIRSQIVILELVAFGFALHLLQQNNVNAQTLVAMLLFCVFAFTLLTGKGIPHFRHRGKALLFLIVAGFFSLQGAVMFEEQREARWAELRVSDPTAYLAELHEVDVDRWFAELRELDPDAYAAEADRRTTMAEAERLAQCTDPKASQAYVMIQADVRRGLVAPSTAEFPGRYGAGTRHVGDCVYRVNGHFDAQNGFGAMLRGTFTGTTRYFPESGSWQTQSLSVN
ncbi:hypothetical protein VWX97_12190 [Phaeobacter sp. JH18-32]|uniref:hypothetical protein n=1 Tax=Phaeobacter TaxID=302485 RepID=UPI003A856CD0